MDFLATPRNFSVAAWINTKDAVFSRKTLQSRKLNCLFNGIFIGAVCTLSFFYCHANIYIRLKHEINDKKLKIKLNYEIVKQIKSNSTIKAAKVNYENTGCFVWMYNSSSNIHKTPTLIIVCH